MITNIYYSNKILCLSEKNSVSDKSHSFTQIFEWNEYNWFLSIDTPVNNWLNNSENYLFIFEKQQTLLSFLNIYLPNKFSVLYAAGGIIQHPQKGYLFIYKGGFWDLPKGKIDTNESILSAAVRECQEETGIENLNVQKDVGLTYHIFKQKQKWMLKITQWFLMFSTNNKLLIPQVEEGIEKVEWFLPDQILIHILPNTYNSIKEILIKSQIIKENKTPDYE